MSTPLTDIYYGTSGPRNARIMIVGESWGEEELSKRVPFVGPTGQELTRILSETNIDREQCLMSNVAAEKPIGNDMWQLFHAREEKVPPWQGLHPKPSTLVHIKNLYSQIAVTKPKLIIAVGNWALWALTDAARLSYSSSTGKRVTPTGITDIRGSMLYYRHDGRTPVLPIIHPSAIQKNWKLRAPTVHDLRVRVPMVDNWTPPKREVFVEEPFLFMKKLLEDLHMRLQTSRVDVPVSVDIENKGSNVITCIGFATSARQAFSIPFVKLTGDKAHPLKSYWPLQEERELLSLIFHILAHPRIFIIGQNYLYDMQYMFEHWGLATRLSFDTNLAHHLLFPGTPGSLGYLSSLYCSHHRYWKDDNREWTNKGTLREHLLYNAEDCYRTFEVYETLKQALVQLKMDHLYPEELRKAHFAFKMMTRAILVDKKARAAMSMQLAEAVNDRQNLLLRLIPQEWINPKPKVAKWVTSPTQQKIVFNELLGLPLRKHSKTKQATLNKEVLMEFRTRFPIFAPIFNALLELRSAKVYKSHFLDAELERNGRYRTSLNPGTVETFRWSSDTNPFGRGGNIQNVPKGKEAEDDELA